MESDVGKDMYKQLKIVSIPVFTGIKNDYSFWKAAFDACIENSNATAEYKFLQLRQYLSDDALKAIEGLGHSKTAYVAVKNRLERKFGEQRQVNKFLEEIDTFPVIKYENARILERFADMLDIALINMKESNVQDRHSGFMYLQLMKKLPESMITRYQRWLYEKEIIESVEALRDWILKESEFHNIAAETKHGLERNHHHGRFEKPKEKTYFGKTGDAKQSQKLCKLCNGKHAIWDCANFKQLSGEVRWKKAKELQLCFQCLGDSHCGKFCSWSRICGVKSPSPTS